MRRAFTSPVPGAHAAPVGAGAQGAPARLRRGQDDGLHAGTERRQAQGPAVLRRLELSGGKLKVQPFYDGSLGNDIAATQSVRTGSLDMVITSTAPLVGMLPSIGVFDLPFLFNNEREAD